MSTPDAAPLDAGGADAPEAPPPTRPADDGGSTPDAVAPDTGAPGAAAEAFYDPANIPAIDLTLDAAAVAVFSSTAPADRKTWVRGTFAHNGTTLHDVGVRRKGSSGFRAMPGKVAVKISFNEFVPGRRYMGLSDLTLNNMVGDPTFLAERLSFHVFRAVGLPSPRANTARLRINGADYGIYANLETPNKDLLARHYGANANTLYEVEYGSQWLPGFEGGFTVDVGDPSRADLLALFQVVKNAKPASLLADLSPRLDVPRFLRYCAAEAVLGQVDGYGYGKFGSHNYFMAGDKAGSFTLLPWSLDLTFSDREGRLDAAKPAFADPVAKGDTVLVRCKASPPCWASYKAEVQSLLAAYATLDLANLARTWNTQIDALVRADPKREAPIAFYVSETAKLVPWIGARPGIVRAQLGLPP